MMDGDIGGYIIWHSFIRAVMMLGTSGNTDRWLQSGQAPSIGWVRAINSVLNPKTKVWMV